MRTLLAIVGLCCASALDAAPQWKPFVEPYRQVFPSLEIATATMDADAASDDAGVIGDQDGLIGVELSGARAGQRFELTVRIPGLARDTRLSGEIPRLDAPVALVPSLSWDYKTLAGIRQSRPAVIEFELSLDGKSLGLQTERVRVRSVNDALYFIDGEGAGGDLDFNWLFAAYVNEDHPAVDAILKEALATDVVDAFTGYQSGDPDEVLKQVFAIWHVLQRRGIRYSSITRTGNAQKRVRSQHVRFIDESLAMSQANCVDGSVLLASVLRKIDLDPALVLTPGHMLLGFALDQKGREHAYLETTLIGNIARPAAPNGKRDAATSAEVDASFNSFTAAMKEGQRQVDAADNAFQDRTGEHQIIDIAAARELGVMPIGG